MSAGKCQGMQLQAGRDGSSSHNNSIFNFKTPFTGGLKSFHGVADPCEKSQINGEHEGHSEPKSSNYLRELYAHKTVR